MYEAGVDKNGKPAFTPTAAVKIAMSELEGSYSWFLSGDDVAKGFDFKNIWEHANLRAKGREAAELIAKDPSIDGLRQSIKTSAQAVADSKAMEMAAERALVKARVAKINKNRSSDFDKAAKEADEALERVQKNRALIEAARPVSGAPAPASSRPTVTAPRNGASSVPGQAPTVEDLLLYGG